MPVHERVIGISLPGQLSSADENASDEGTSNEFKELSECHYYHPLQGYLDCEAKEARMRGSGATPHRVLTPNSVIWHP
jgi:hypothetical protein